MTIQSQCEQRGISVNTYYSRRNILGWSHEKALNTPIQKKFSNGRNSMKRICMFCGRSHRLRAPRLCIAKGKVLSAWVKDVGGPRTTWAVFAYIESREGYLEFEAAAKNKLATMKTRGIASVRGKK